jgi:UTP--glucose-1-phosphate uridylyltransferase
MEFRYDCGSKFGYLQASVQLAEAFSEVGKEFSAYLRSLLQ